MPHELDMPIHERTCARYTVYVRLTSGVKLPLLYEAQPMQIMDVGKRIFLRRLRKLYVNGAVRRLRSRHRHWAWRILGCKFDVILSMRRSLGAPFT